MKTNWKTPLVLAIVTGLVAPGCITQHGDDTEDDGSLEPDSEEPSETSTLRVENKSSYTVADLYMWRCGEPSNTHDQLGSKTIAPGAALSLTGVPPGCWYIHARSSTTYWQTPQGVTFSRGKLFTWQLFNSE
jgi:hypothetical protein